MVPPKHKRIRSIRSSHRSHPLLNNALETLGTSELVTERAWLSALSTSQVVTDG